MLHLTSGMYENLLCYGFLTLLLVLDLYLHVFMLFMQYAIYFSDAQYIDYIDHRDIIFFISQYRLKIDIVVLIL